MSGAPATDHAVQAAVATLGRVAAGCRCVAFWVACLAPLAYVPLFVLPAEWWSPGVLSGAIGVHLLALVVARDHRAPDGG